MIPIGQQHDVFVVEPSAVPPIAHRRQVTIGARRPGEVEIKEGLEAGEFVVIHGGLRVRPDQPVAITAVAKGDESLDELLPKGQGKAD